MKTTPTRDASEARSSRSVKVSPRKTWAKRPVRAGVRKVRVVESESLIKITTNNVKERRRRRERKKRGREEFGSAQGPPPLKTRSPSLLQHHHSTEKMKERDRALTSYTPTNNKPRKAQRSLLHLSRRATVEPLAGQ